MGFMQYLAGSSGPSACPARRSAAASGEQQSISSSRFLSRLAGALMSKGGTGYKTGESAVGHMAFPKVDPPVLEERGAVVNKETGERQTSAERLYMQLQVLDLEDISSFNAAVDALKALLSASDIPSVIYADANHPGSLGVLTWTRDPSFFVLKVNPVLQALFKKFKYSVRDGWTMIGRSYSNGHEKDLKDFLFTKPVRNVLHPERKWAVWYPMRRDGMFYMEPPSEQCRMLLHHAAIGKSYAEVDAAFDVRLASYGIDAKDNEFLVGLIAKELFGLSKIVQDMRKTEHTSHYLKSLGPFFVGYKLWQNGSAADA